MTKHVDVNIEYSYLLGILNQMHTVVLYAIGNISVKF